MGGGATEFCDDCLLWMSGLSLVILTGSRLFGGDLGTAECDAEGLDGFATDVDAEDNRDSLVH